MQIEMRGIDKSFGGNAVFISAPFAICTENAPFNVSPAPVVSTTLAGLAGTVNISPVSKHVETPFDPWVINNFPAYFLRSSSDESSFPNISTASCSFGVK